MGELLGSQSHRPGDRSPLGLKRPERALPGPRRGGREIEPADLILDVTHHPERPELSVGADLSRAGIVVPSAGVPAQQAGVPF